jgi:hypothetical protein
VRAGLGGNAATTWRISETEALQRVLDGLATEDSSEFRGGARLWLAKGTYDCDIAVNHPWIELCGDGEGTEVLGRVTVYAGQTKIHNMTIRGAGKQYALRLMRNPAAGFYNMPRNSMSNLVIGASYQGAGDGPVNGVEIDGTWITDFSHVTSAFCTENGWLIDSTNALYPNTTLGFTDCSAVGNAICGWDVRQSLTCGHWLRGNVEQNGYGGTPANNNEMRFASVINITLEQLDFESNQALSDAIFISNCTVGEVKNCNFVQAKSGDLPGPIPRFLNGASSSHWHVHHCRVENYPAGRNAQFDERGTRNSIHHITYADATTPVDNRSVHHEKVFSSGHPTRMNP